MLTSLAGDATATGGQPQEGALFVAPYALAGAHKSPGVAVLPVWNAGLDASARFGKRLHGQLTVNTDFAQVDLDDQVLNLTRFELFMPEKRDFFAKDVDLFAFGKSGVTQGFFSRRIGLSPSGPVPVLVGSNRGGGRLHGLLSPPARYIRQELARFLFGRWLAGISALSAPRQCRGRRALHEQRR